MFEYITLERTMCNGECPVYKVLVNSTGKVIYEGYKNVYKSGKHEWKISKDRIRKIKELLQNFDYKSFKYKHKNPGTIDYPSCITAVKYIDGEFKTIFHNLGHSGFDRNLMKFENQVEEITDTFTYSRQRA
jgi:hypothetical protein